MAREAELLVLLLLLLVLVLVLLLLLLLLLLLRACRDLRAGERPGGWAARCCS